jgi:ATP-dependent helicase Lhr and Lhr-like helicase
VQLLETGILMEVTGVLGMGSEGEAEFGRRYFQELVAAFTTPLLLAVRHGSNDLGSIDPLSLETQRTSASSSVGAAGACWKSTGRAARSASSRC